MLGQNRSEDEYTRYELLAPETASFKIICDVTAVSPGATHFFNPIRIGSVASDESVVDLMTGAPLAFEEVSGADARATGLPDASLEGRYIRVRLARSVPQGGEARIRIIKTYKDPKSYRRDGEALVFDRPLGIKRNAVILPPGYQLVSCNVPSQVLEEADGRIGISFMNLMPSHAPLVIRAKPLGHARTEATPARPAVARDARPAAAGESPAVEPPMERVRVSERAFWTADCLLPPGAIVARVQPVSRLQWYARHRPVREHRAARKHRVESVRQNPGYGRSAQGRDTQR